MGHDGLEGCQRIKSKGGKVVIQDEESSVVYGMPGSVAEAGLADIILPLTEMPHFINNQSLSWKKY